MPFRATFDCLWCGRRHEVRSPSDLEGWAHLCSDCLGRAGDNGFLRARLRAALEERAAGSRRLPGPGRTEAPSDDWYLGRGDHQRAPRVAAGWPADLDEVTFWLDRLPWHGEVVELEAGGGWWSPLLAGKGELHVYDRSDEALGRARDRLVAHRLRAHLHGRDPWAEPDRQVDGVLAAFWLSGAAGGREREALGLLRRWLKPGGLLALIDETEGTDALPGAVVEAGFVEIEAARTSRYFRYVRGVAPGAP